MRQNMVFGILICLLLSASAAGSAGFQYDGHGKRDPFVSLVSADRQARTGLADVRMPDELKLEGIAAGAGGEPIAILNGEIVREGRKYGEVEIKKIDRTSITVYIDGVAYSLALRKEE